MGELRYFWIWRGIAGTSWVEVALSPPSEVAEDVDAAAGRRRPEGTRRTTLNAECDVALVLPEDNQLGTALQ
jgi:hypothetical protein